MDRLPPAELPPGGAVLEMTMSAEQALDHLKRACLSKHAYSEKEAQIVVQRMRSNKRFRKPNAHAYLCQFCGHWHAASRALKKPRSSPR